jgi:hypothetical protein
MKTPVSVKLAISSVTCLFAALMAGALLNLAAAAEPKPAPADAAQKQIEKERNQLKNKGVSDMLKSGEVREPKDFDRYFELSLELFSVPTNLSRVHLTRFLIKKDLNAAGNAERQEAHDRANNYLLSKLPEMATNGKEIVTRVNAMLLLADLDAQELKLGGAGLATPLPAALPLLIEAYRTADQSDAVKVAALVGVLRHAESGIADNEVRDLVLDEMIQTVAAKTAPTGRSEEGHIWIRRRAADILSALGATGTEKDATLVVQVLATIVEDKNEPLPLRADAARALGQLKLETPPDLNLSRLAELVANLAIDATNQETNRRGLRHYLNAVEVSLKGPPPPTKPGEPPTAAPLGGIAGTATAEPHQEYLTGLVAAIDPLFKLVIDEKVEDDNLAFQIETTRQDLVTWLQDNPPAAQGLVADVQ